MLTCGDFSLLIAYAFFVFFKQVGKLHHRDLFQRTYADRLIPGETQV